MGRRGSKSAERGSGVFDSLTERPEETDEFTMNAISVDPKLVAYCGLYCGACGVYRRGRCPGCRENAKAVWCKVRTCGIANGYHSCVDCTAHPNPKECRTFNNIVSRLFELVFRSNRSAGIARIRQVGTEGYAREMAAAGRHSPPR